MALPFSKFIDPEHLTEPSSLIPVFFLLVFNEFGLPLPIVYESLLLYTGYHLALGQIKLLGVALFGLLGSLLGASLVFWIFFFLGPVVLKSKFFKARAEKLNALKRELLKKEILAVVLGRLTPGFLSLTSVVSGALNLSYFRFALGVFLSNFVWAVVLVTAGFVLGQATERFENLGFWSGRLTLILGFVSLLFFLGLLKKLVAVLKNNLTA